MAKSWTVAEAVQIIVEGTNLAAIQDIGRRFPLFAVSANGGQTGLLTIIAALSDKVTVRTLEAKLKEGVDESTLEDDAETTEEAAPAKKAPAKKAPTKKAPAKKEVEEEEDEDVFEEEEEKALEDMTQAELKAEAKKRKISIAGLRTKKDVIAALTAGDEEDEDSWDDEEEEEEVKPAPKKKATAKKPAAKGKAPAKKTSSKSKAVEEDDEEEDWDF